MSISLYRDNTNLSSLIKYKEKYDTYSSYSIISNSIMSYIKDSELYSKDIFQNRIYNLLVQTKEDNDIIHINALALDYLCFKDIDIIKTSTHLIIDGLLTLSKITGINLINIYLYETYLEEKQILIKAIKEAKEIGYLNKVEISIFTDKAITYNDLNKFKFLFCLESVANIALIAQTGAFSKLKKEKNDSLLISMTGDIKNIGLYEVEVGTSLTDLIRASGGIKKEHAIKCVFVGGFSSKPLSENEANRLKISYEDFNNNGILMGNGIICVIKESTCIIRVILKIVSFGISISCKKCFPCMNGFVAVKYYLEEILINKATKNHITIIKEILDMIYLYSLCEQIKLLSKSINNTIEMFESEIFYAIENKSTMYSFYEPEESVE